MFIKIGQKDCISNCTSKDTSAPSKATSLIPSVNNTFCRIITYIEMVQIAEFNCVNCSSHKESERMID